ncbi:PAS-domain containing protein [Leeia oryzae]|uniref:PAS-domain containing protein n=1 Tax=Leeia oryzae TaxID=356662 RepID=UPI0003736943|nr:PAS-domain containing protein [Leeia oryzae]
MRSVKSLLSWLPETVRVRLLLAFLVMFLSSMALALVGWWGMKDTRDALKDFQSRVLPDIARSLEMAQRTSSLAAMAPYVAETNLPFQLQTEADALRARLYEAAKLARGLSQKGPERLEIEPALEALDHAIEELIAVTRKDLFLREDLREHLYQLDRLHNGWKTLPQKSPLDVIYRDLQAAGSVSDAAVLDMLQADVNSVMAQIPAAQQDILNELNPHIQGDRGIFGLRRQQFQLHEKKAFLLALTRAEAARLGQQVDHYVVTVGQLVDRQAVSVSRTVQSGILGIGVLTLLCVLVAAFGAGVANRLVKTLGAITRVMSRLAEGDTEQAVPSLSRKDELGALARAFQVFRDNTLAVRRMANDLKAQRKLLETVFENINDGLSVFDKDGCLLTWNPRYVSLLGLSESKVKVGVSLQTIQSWLPSPDISSALPTLDALNDARQRNSQRIELTYPDGRVIEFRSNPMPGGGFVTLYSDLTERRAVEAQLRQSQKMDVLGQLTGGVAHDFNNLLAAIMGNLYLLENTPALDEKLQKYTVRARQAAERGGMLTQRLLAFARRQALKPEAVEVDGLVQELADLIEYSIGTGIQLELKLQAGSACAWLDRGQLENALLNLALNARDAMGQVGKLTLETHVLNDQGMIRLDVVDTGTGIPESIRDRVFEPFFTTKAGSGSGLGLSIIYGFIKQSGGDIQLHSQTGQGTCFSLLLPWYQEERPAQQGSAVPTPHEVPASSILLVEDEADVREALVDILAEMNMQVVAASTVEEALRLLENTWFDCVLSDVDLGQGGNGVMLRDQILAMNPQMPVLLMSGLPADMLAERFSLPESAVLLAKPFTLESLKAALSSVLLPG